MTIDQKAEHSRNKKKMINKAAKAALNNKSAYTKDRATSILGLLSTLTQDEDTLTAGWLFIGQHKLKDVQKIYGNQVTTILVQACGPLDRAGSEAKKIRLAEFFQSVQEDNIFGNGSKAKRRKLLKKFNDIKCQMYYDLEAMFKYDH